VLVSHRVCRMCRVCRACGMADARGAVRRGLRRLEVAGTGRRSEGSALRPQLEPPNARMRFGSPMVRALFRTAEQEIGPQRRPSGTPPAHTTTHSARTHAN
jgi:hypothetical protein